MCAMHCTRVYKNVEISLIVQIRCPLPLYIIFELLSWTNVSCTKMDKNIYIVYCMEFVTEEQYPSGNRNRLAADKITVARCSIDFLLIFTSSLSLRQCAQATLPMVIISNIVRHPVEK